MIQSVFFFTFFQSIFLSILSLIKRDKELADHIIGPWMILLGGQIICYAISFSYDNNAEWNIFSFIGLSISTLHAPFLFLYSKHITRSERPHLISIRYNIILVVILCILGCILVNKLNYIVFYVRIFSMFVNIIYGVISLFVFYRYKNYIVRNFSSLDKLNIVWFKLIVLGLLLYGLVIAISLTITLFFHIEFPTKTIVGFFMLVFVNMLFCRRVFIQDDRVRQMLNDYDKWNVILLDIIKNLDDHHEPVVDSLVKDSSYLNSGLKECELLQIADSLKKSMEEDQLYKDTDLTLKDLAAKLNIYPHYITQTLNTIIGQKFYDFVNTYRVEEAKAQLLNDNNNQLTILAIGFESGFNSKSSFNRIFKQKTGYSPSEFKNNHSPKV